MYGLWMFWCENWFLSWRSFVVYVLVMSLYFFSEDGGKEKRPWKWKPKRMRWKNGFMQEPKTNNRSPFFFFWFSLKFSLKKRESPPKTLIFMRRFLFFSLGTLSISFLLSFYFFLFYSIPKIMRENRVYRSVGKKKSLEAK